jgi:non-canonical (house-cleaning) NTP pyrophosphatase
MTTEDVQSQDDIEQPQGEAVPDTEPQGDAPNLDDVLAQLQTLKAASRKWEKYAKQSQAENEQLRTQIGALVSPEQVQTAEEALSQANARADSAERDAMRYRIGVEAGLPPKLIKRLQGATEDELIADAEALAQEFAVNKPKAQAAKDGQTATPAKAQPSQAELLKAIVYG